LSIGRTDRRIDTDTADGGAIEAVRERGEHRRVHWERCDPVFARPLDALLRWRSCRSPRVNDLAYRTGYHEVTFCLVCRT
jgi:hypothetical protein